MNVLVVTNDFPPRTGGIEDYVANLLERLPPTTSALVIGPPHADAATFDASFAHPVVRWPRYPMLPTPRLARAIVEQVQAHRADVVIFGAALPLALTAGVVARRTRVPIVTFTHGVEPALASSAGGRLLIRGVARHTALMTAVSGWAERRLLKAVDGAVRVERLPSGIDPSRFRPDVSGDEVRRRHALGDAPVVVCLARLVRRKGIDQVIRALSGVAREIPAVRVVVAGDGPDRARLERLARSEGVASRVAFVGRVSHDDLPRYLAAGDVFALPCRSRFGGLEDEGLGAVYLQAAGVGRPAIAGRAGGAPEAVKDEETGLVVDGRSSTAIGEALLRLLRDPAEARRLGECGARRVHREMTWDLLASRLHQWLVEIAR